MLSPISNATQPQPVAQARPTSAAKPDRPEPPFAPNTDSVQLSKTAQAMAAAMQEARETPTQTAREAGHGDLQAQRLLARQAAVKPVAR